MFIPRLFQAGTNKNQTGWGGKQRRSGLGWAKGCRESGLLGEEDGGSDGVSEARSIGTHLSLNVYFFFLILFGKEREILPSAGSPLQNPEQPRSHQQQPGVPSSSQGFWWPRPGDPTGHRGGGLCKHPPPQYYNTARASRASCTRLVRVSVSWGRRGTAVPMPSSPYVQEPQPRGWLVLAQGSRTSAMPGSWALAAPVLP